MPKRKVQTSITSFSESTERDESNSKKLKFSEGRSKKARTPETLKTVNETEKRQKTAKEDKKPFNKIDTDFRVIDFNCEKLSLTGKRWNFKISSWNVVSLKSITNKNGMDFVRHELPDIMCFQETKCSEKKVPQEAKLSEYHRYFAAGIKTVFFVSQNTENNEEV